MLLDYKHWIEAFHIIAVIMWMAGMLYLPRLYVYHTQVNTNSESDSMLKIMERRLLRYIMNPAMIAVIALGIVLSIITQSYYQNWFHAKMLFVTIMVIIHMMLAKYRKNFEANLNSKTTLYFRILNEIVTLLIVIIVILVVVKPLL